MIVSVERIKKFNTQTASHLASDFGNSLRELWRCDAHRSNRTTFTKTGIQLNGFKNDLTENNEFNTLVDNVWIGNEADYYLPTAGITVDIQRQEQEVTIYVLNDRGDNQRIIMYLTGGTYIQRPDKTYWRYLNRLTIATDTKIYVPIYSLIPHATFRTAYQEIASPYSKIYILIPASKVAIIDDSADGGLAAGFYEYLSKKGLP